MQKSDRDPGEFLTSLPEGAREPMQRLDRLIGEIMAGHTRVIWEGTFWGGTEQIIVGYGDLSMVQSRGRTVEWFMVGLARQKNWFSVYVNAVEDRQYVVEKYAEALGKVKTGKSSINFRSIDGVNLDTLATVVTIARDQLDHEPAPR